MPKLKFPEPMTCQQVRGLFANLLTEKLDAERRGRVEGHLLACEECSVAFAEEIDQALARGDLPQPAGPPLSMPGVLMDVSGSGVVKAWLWEVVKREGKAVLEVAQGAVATTKALGAGVAEVGRRKEAKQLLENLRYWLQSSFLQWQSADEPEPMPAMGVRAVRARGGRAVARAVIQIRHLNEAWEPTDAELVGEVEQGPVFTADSKFFFTVTSDDKRLEGQRLICTIRLVEDQAIRFETDVQFTSDRTRWRAEFRAEELPTAAEDMLVPLERVELYLVALRRDMPADFLR